MENIDSPGRIAEIRRSIEGKQSLRRFYEEVYREYERCLQRCPRQGIALELGSGAGFAKEIIPFLVTSDVIPYDGIDLVVDGTRLPYRDGALRMVCMMNVFHHIPDAGAFLREAQRCLMSGGRMLIMDQHVGLFSRLILEHLHHEHFDPGVRKWEFDTTGPLSGANGALAWVVFRRDHALLEQMFPHLSVVRYEPHAPLRYWLAGGLKKWNLLPGRAYQAVRQLDALLVRASSKFGSFVYIEVVKK